MAFPRFIMNPAGLMGGEHERERMRRNTKDQQSLASRSLNVTVQCKPMLNYIAHSGMASGLISLANYTGCRSMPMPLTASVTQAGVPT